MRTITTRCVLSEIGAHVIERTRKHSCGLYRDLKRRKRPVVRYQQVTATGMVGILHMVGHSSSINFWGHSTAGHVTPSVALAHLLFLLNYFFLKLCFKLMLTLIFHVTIGRWRKTTSRSMPFSSERLLAFLCLLCRKTHRANLLAMQKNQSVDRAGTQGRSRVGNRSKRKEI